MRRALLAALVVTVATGAWILGRAPRGGRDSSSLPAAEPPAADVQLGGALPRAAENGHAAENIPGRPRSLRGTRVDGGLAVDAAGRFVPTLDARRLFDHVLTGSGELSREELRARILREIDRRLAPEPAREATALLDRYLAYGERVRQLAAADALPTDDLEGRFDLLHALRREMLGPEAAEAFFTEEEAEVRRILEVRRLANDPNLSPEERRRRLEAIAAEAAADLPPEARAAREAGRLAATLRDAEAELRARGGSPEEIQALRERLAGPEAAARLAELDRRRGEWQARLDAFRAARRRVQEDPALTDDQRAVAIARLLDESFEPAERRRLEALDRLAEEPPGDR